MRSLKLLVIPATLLSGYACAALTQPYLMRKLERFVGTCAYARGGRITFKAKEGATIARAFEPMRVGFSPVGNPGMLDFLVEHHQGVFDPFQVSIAKISDPAPYGVVTLETDHLTEIGLPEANVNASEPATISFDLAVRKRERREEAFLNPVDRQINTKQKKWLCSNFRVRIGDLPASRISKVDSITIKQGVADLDGDGAEEFVREQVRIDVAMPKTDAAPYLRWFQLAEQGHGFTLPLQMTYMDGDIPLLNLDTEVEIVSVDFDDLFTDPYIELGTVRVQLRSINDSKKGILSIIR